MLGEKYCYLHYRKDTELLYHSFMYSLLSLLSGICVTSPSVCNTEVTASIGLKIGVDGILSHSVLS